MALSLITLCYTHRDCEAIMGKCGAADCGGKAHDRDPAVLLQVRSGPLCTRVGARGIQGPGVLLMPARSRWELDEDVMAPPGASWLDCTCCTL